MMCCETGEVVPASCGALSCQVCGHREALRRCQVMSWPVRHADRARLVTLTRLPVLDDGTCDWQRARSQVRDLCRRLRQDYAVEWAWALERNPRETGYHAHLIQHGDYIPQRVLETRWGGRRVDIRQVKATAGQYVLKEARTVAGYPVKGTHSDLAGHLAINGRRVYHASRWYHRGLTQREVLAEIRRERKDLRTWVLMLPPSEGTGSTPMLSASGAATR